MINRLAQSVALQTKNSITLSRALAYGFAEDPTKTKDTDYVNKGGD